MSDLVLSDLVGVLQALQLVVFVALGLAALRQWYRRRDEASAWLAVSFSVLGVIVLASRVLEALPASDLTRVAQSAIIGFIAVFPYALFRFTGPFVDTPHRATNRIALASTLVLAVWPFLLGDLPGGGEPRTTAFNAYVVGLLAHWLVWSLAAAARLWRAGAGQARLPRRRMRLLALGAVALSAALLVSASAGGVASNVVDLTSTLLGLVSAPLFYLGFNPPLGLRAAWRAPADRSLREAELGLVGATTPEEVVAATMPFVQNVLGASGAALVSDDGEVVFAEGVDDPDGLVAAVIAGDPRSAGALTVRVRDGWLAVQAASVTPFFGTEELGMLGTLGTFVGIAMDRAELFAAERRMRLEIEEARAALEDANTELERSNAELEQFAYIASHDLQEPLRKVASYTQLLARRYRGRLDDDADEFIDYAVDGARRMQELIDDLLTYSRVGRDEEFEPVPLVNPLDRALANLSVALEDAGAEIVVGDLPKVLGDASQLSMLFQNLIANAIKFRSDAPPIVRIEAVQRDGMVEVAVADNGIGIDPEYHERVFRVFQRLHGRQKYPGTGIGLAICARVVERHGGTIEVESEAGQGTTFRITLQPASDAHQGADGTAT